MKLIKCSKKLKYNIGIFKTTFISSNKKLMVVSMVRLLMKNYFIQMKICMIIKGILTYFHKLMNYLKILSIMIGTKKISLVDKYGAEIISPEEDRKIKYQNE